MKRIYQGVALAAIMALCLSGGAVAASKITGSQVKDSTLTGKDIKNHSITGTDFKGALPRGPKGPAGPAGATGPGMTALKTVESASVDLAPGFVTTSAWVAQCPAGMRVIGTGFYNSIATIGFVKSYGTFVGGILFNETGATATGVHLQAICAAVPAGAVLARASGAKSAFLRDREAALAKAH
jgi:hypothetical protein